MIANLRSYSKRGCLRPRGREVVLSYSVVCVPYKTSPLSRRRNHLIQKTIYHFNWRVSAIALWIYLYPRASPRASPEGPRVNYRAIIYFLSPLRRSRWFLVVTEKEIKPDFQSYYYFKVVADGLVFWKKSNNLSKKKGLFCNFDWSSGKLSNLIRRVTFLTTTSVVVN